MHKSISFRSAKLMDYVGTLTFGSTHLEWSLPNWFIHKNTTFQKARNSPQKPAGACHILGEKIVISDARNTFNASYKRMKRRYDRKSTISFHQLQVNTGRRLHED